MIWQLWGDGPTNDEVRDLLLKLIWQGAIEGCADIAESAANNVDLSPSHRIAGVRALLACDQDRSARRIADSLLRKPDRWPERVIHGLAPDLFPKVISVVELIALIERTPEPKNTFGGFDWALRQIVETIDPWSSAGVELRQKLSDLIWRGRNAKQEWHQINGRFDYVTPALALLCDRQLSAAPDRRDPDLIWACVIAKRFGDAETGAESSSANWSGISAALHRYAKRRFGTSSP